MNNPFNSGLRKTAELVLKFTAIAAMGAGLVGCASTGPAPGGYMQLGARAAPPAGFIDFCARKPGECGLKVAVSDDAPPQEAQARLQKTLYKKYLWAVTFPAAVEEPSEPPRPAQVLMTSAPPAAPLVSDLVYRPQDVTAAPAEMAQATVQPALLAWAGKSDAVAPPPLQAEIAARRLMRILNK